LILRRGLRGAWLGRGISRRVAARRIRFGLRLGLRGEGSIPPGAEERERRGLGIGPGGMEIDAKL